MPELTENSRSLDLTSLSFVSLSDETGTYDLWTPERTGQYGDDCTIGRMYAAELVTFMQDSGNTSIFGSIIRAITRQGQFEGVEQGFCAALGIQIAGIGPAQVLVTGARSILPTSGAAAA